MSILLISFGILIAACVFLWQSSRLRDSAGMSGVIIYKDSHDLEENQKSFYHKEFGLAGRPDYLIREKDHVIPVEVKSTKRVSAPYDSHIFQLAAYCLLVESNFGQTPPYGILAYPDKRFKIPFSETLRQETIRLIEELRNQGRKRKLPRSHEEAARCRGCGFNYDCEDSLS